VTFSWTLGTVVSALAICACAGASGADKARPPVEAYIAPPSIFPPEGKFAKGGAKAYKPFPVHASPDGALVGHVDTNYVKCGNDCETPTASFVALDGKRQPLEVQAWYASTSGLVAYDVPVVKGDVAWTRIRFAKGEFWIKTPRKDVHGYEGLSNFADNFDTVCTKPGNCQPVTAAMRKHIAALPFLGCVGYPYEVRKVVTVEGKRYYEVEMQEIELGKIKLQIPRKGFVPTRNKDGSHTGIGENNDC
jgi:hypothetical protein